MGDKHSLLVFVRVASQQHLFGEVYRSRYVDSFMVLVGSRAMLMGIVECRTGSRA